MNKRLLLLVTVFLIGIALRFYNLGEIPISLHRDEAFLGYNAYSILKTGKDISGHFLPIHLESFFFSPAGYSYLLIPVIKLLGLSEFSIRFPSALLGSLTILLVYLISLSLFEKNKKKEKIALFSSLFFAISPWHINLSRVAVENTAAVFFITLGILLYLRYVKGNKITVLSLSFISFASTFIIYQAPRVFLPLFIPFLAISIANFRKIIKDKFQILLFIILIISPLIFIIFSPNLSWRIQSLSIFQHPEVKLVIQEQLTTDTLQGVPSLVSRAFHNKLVGFTSLFLDNYFAHLSFDFLFQDSGFPDRFRIPKMGLLYLFELPFIIFALFTLFTKEKRIGIFILGWILLSFVGSALTFDDIPNLQRTLMAVPALSILSGFGLFSFLATLEQKNPAKNIAITIIFLVILYNFSYYLIQYYAQGKVYRPWYRQDGYRELVKKVSELLPNYQKAVITNRETAPTIMFLFYSRYDPKKFQEETRNVDMKRSNHVSFANYEFSEEQCPVRIDIKTGELTGEEGILYVNSSLCEDVAGTKKIATIKRVDGSEVFKILDIK